MLILLLCKECLQTTKKNTHIFKIGKGWQIILKRIQVSKTHRKICSSLIISVISHDVLLEPLEWESAPCSVILRHCIYHSDGKLHVYTSLSMVCVLSRGKHGPHLAHLYTFSSSCQALCLVNIHKHRYTSSFCILKRKSDGMFQKRALNSH